MSRGDRWMAEGLMNEAEVRLCEECERRVRSDLSPIPQVQRLSSVSHIQEYVLETDVKPVLQHIFFGE